MFIFLVTGDAVGIVYADRQGVIQLQGINFLKDLPSFFVLLFALQRLELKEWGLNSGPDGRVYQMHEFYSDGDGMYEKASWSVAVKDKLFNIYGQNVLYSALTMAGREPSSLNVDP